MKHSNKIILLAGLSLALPVLPSAQQAVPPGAQSPDAAAPAAAKPGQVSPELAALEDKLDTKAYDAVKPELLQYLVKHPQDARAHFDLGYLDENIGQEEAAVVEYQKAVIEDPQQFEARLALGLALARKCDQAGAHEQLQAATERQPATANPAAQAQAYRALAELDLTSDPPAAKQALLAALKLSQETAADLLLTARIASANDDNETAETAYRRLIAQQPDSVEGLAGLAHLFVQQKKYADAQPLLETALGRIPDDPGLNMQYASLLAAEGKPEDSISSLEKLHTKLPDDGQVSRMLADAYLAAHKPEQAEPLLAAALKTQPKDADLLDEEGQTLIYQQRYEAATVLFARASNLNAADVDAWSGLAFADSKAHKDTDALRALTMRSKVAQDTPSILFLWAITYDNLHQAKLAAEYYHKFLDSANGKFPDQEWQAKHRLVTLGGTH